jgi:predicted DNA-binding protein YlxM (UPF0122 family)
VSKSASIRRMLAENKTVAEIAKKLKVSPQHVYVVRSADKKKAKKNASFQKKLPKLLMQRKAKAEKRMKEIVEESQTKTQTLGEYLQSIREKGAAEAKARDEAAMERWYPFEEVKDMVNHPDHYKVGGIETIDFIEAKKLNYNLGNVVKYITRADHKGNREQDLNKALWYLTREIQKLSEV